MYCLGLRISALFREYHSKSIHDYQRVWVVWTRNPFFCSEYIAVYRFCFFELALALQH